MTDYKIRLPDSKGVFETCTYPGRDVGRIISEWSTPEDMKRCENAIRRITAALDRASAVGDGDVEVSVVWINDILGTFKDLITSCEAMESRREWLWGRDQTPRQDLPDSGLVKSLRGVVKVFIIWPCPDRVPKSIPVEEMEKVLTAYRAAYQVLMDQQKREGWLVNRLKETTP